MNDLLARIQQRFLDNITYLQHHHPDVFSKLAALDNAVANGQYTEKYELVFENDCFEVIEKATGIRLYDGKSSEHSALAVQSIDFGTEYNTFNLLEKYSPISQEHLDRYAGYRHFEHQMSGFAPILAYIQRHSSPSETLNRLYKYIFFGVGLGLHIGPIHERIKAESYLIVENDLELFRLSLFITDYTYLSTQTKLFLSVFDNPNEFRQLSERFLSHNYFHNHYIKFFPMLHHSDDRQNDFHLVISSESHKLFFYHSLLTQYLKPLNYLFGGYRLIGKQTKFHAPLLQNNPFLLVAAGPSLQKNLAWLKENHSKFIIVALSATLSILEKEGIIPDIVTHLDAFDTAAVHFKKLRSKEFLHGCIALFSARTPQEIIDFANRDNLFLFENGTQYMNRSLKPSAPCVGSLTYQLMLLLEAGPLYLLGLDLAIDASTGKTHADAHEYGKILDLATLDSSVLTYKESIVHVTGNFQSQVPTTPHFKTSIDTINLSTAQFKKAGHRIYNLNDGARFEETIPLKTDQLPSLPPIDKQTIHHHLKSLFQNNALLTLTHEEIQTLRLNLQQAEALLHDASTLFKPSSETGGFQHALESFIQILTQPDALGQFAINRVLDTYLRYITPYIIDFLNHPNTVEPHLHVATIQELLLFHIQEIIQYYTEHVNRHLDQTIRKREHAID